MTHEQEHGGNRMAEWTGKWHINEYYEKCACGNEKGIKVIVKTFDADHIDAMIHDGEEVQEKECLCEQCRKNTTTVLGKSNISWEEFIKTRLLPNGELRVE